MVMLREALAAEREKRKRETGETAEQREVGRAVLQALVQRLTADSVPTWFFMLSDDEVSVLRIKNGASARERQGGRAPDSGGAAYHEHCAAREIVPNACRHCALLFFFFGSLAPTPVRMNRTAALASR